MTVVAAVAIALAGCGGGGGSGSADHATLSASAPATATATVTADLVATAPGILGISASPQLVPYPTTPEELGAAFTNADNMAYDAGARGQTFTFTWAAIEPSAGRYDTGVLSDLQSALNYAQARSLKQYVGIQVINTSTRSMPPDLVGLAFDDPIVQSRFRLLIDQVVGAHRGLIRYLSIGNEVDSYLTAHPAEIPSYQTFYVHAAQYARLSDPAILVGVTGTASGAVANPGATLLKNLNAAGSDVAILTYYPIQSDASGTLTVRSPSVVAGDFTQMLAFAGSKPLVLQEVGYPASAVNLSSEAMQATFIRNVFTAWKGAGGRIPFLDIFLLHDFTDATCDSLVVYYGVSAPSFRAYLCTLGMLKVDGTPRAAWAALLDESAKAGLP